MHIGIDSITTRNQFRHRGIGNYTSHIIEWLPKVDPSVKILSDLSERWDVFIQPYFEYGLPDVDVPKVVMVHDLIPLATGIYSQRSFAANLVKSLLYRQNLKWLCQADLLLTNSYATKLDLVRLLQIPEDKIRVVWLGIDPQFFSKKLAKITPPKPYIFHIGGVEANKNLLRLVTAFSLVSKKYPALTLVIGGEDATNRNKPETKQLYRHISSLDLTSKVCFPGLIPQSELPAWYHHAAVFVYPSLYEGFGFPPLEAMAAGVPVAASQVASIPEVCGEAARLFDPWKVEEIAKAISDLLDDPSERRGLILRAQRRAKLFTWRDCAKKTLRVLREVAKK